MRKLTLILAVMVIFMGMHTDCFAGYNIGHDLVPGWVAFKMQAEGAVDAPTAEEARVFQAYVKGVADVIIDNGAAISVGAAIPAGVTIEQLCTVVGNYLEAHFSDLGGPASALVIKALEESYPAKGKS